MSLIYRSLLVFLIACIFSFTVEAVKFSKSKDSLIRGIAESPFSKSHSAFLCYEKGYMRPALQKKFFPFESFCIFFTSERR